MTEKERAFEHAAITSATPEEFKGILGRLNRDISPTFSSSHVITFVPLLYCTKSKDDVEDILKDENSCKALRLHFWYKGTESEEKRNKLDVQRRQTAERLYDIKESYPLSKNAWDYINDRINASKSPFDVDKVCSAWNNEHKKRYPDYLEDYNAMIKSRVPFSDNSHLNNVIKLYISDHINVKDLWTIDQRNKSMISNMNKFKKKYPSMPLAIMSEVIASV